MLKNINKLLLVVISSLLLTGCNNTNEKVENNIAEANPGIEKTEITEQTDETVTSDEEISEETIDESEDNDYKSISVTFDNSTGFDFGLLSIMDPVNEEQINIDSLMKDETLSMDMLWKKDESTFKWAVYDTEGDLIAECETDFTEIDDFVKITLQGNGQLEDVDVSFEK